MSQQPLRVFGITFIGRFSDFTNKPKAACCAAIIDSRQKRQFFIRGVIAFCIIKP